MVIRNKIFILIITLMLGFTSITNITKAEDDPLPEADTTAPIITLLGESSISLNVGDVYVDAGATAQDNIDGDITASIVVNNLVNSTIAGDYTVTYTVSDASGNSANPVVRNVTVNNLPAAQETFIIRNGNEIIWQGSVALPATGTVVINDFNGIAHTINSQSVLAVLHAADQASDAFAISHLQYFDSFNSFYLKCIITAGGVELCDNWQYAIGNMTPWQSIDASILSGDQTIGIYFGTPHRLTFESNNVQINTPFVVNAQNYNYTDNSWSPLLGVSVGATLPNPEDPWSPIVVTTQMVDSHGSASLTISQPNTYDLGIVEDFYFPSYPITVSLPISSGGGGGNAQTMQTQPAKKTFDVPEALAYLESVQEINGSFANLDLYTDWAAIAYSAADLHASSSDSLLDYLKNNSQLSTLLTDNERRVMSLLALGQNPYNFENINYIEAILTEFDGQQFGDNALVNDDIFAIIPLLSSGYTKDDEIISQAIAYILSEQNTDGSWNNSIDVTAAAIQALQLANPNAEVLAAINQAESYLVNQQQDHGGFTSIYATSWAAQAMSALNKTWTKNENTPLDYLGSIQTEDGAALVETESLANRIWATSYAIPAALGKTWNSIFHPVAKPVVPEIILPPTEPEVLGVKETIEEEKPVAKAPVVIKNIITPKVSAATSTDDNQNNLSSTTADNNIQKKATNTPLTDTNDTNNIFVKLLVGLLIIVGGIFVIKFWKK